MPKKLTQKPLSRIQILDRPLAHPGKCVICGASRDDDRSYVDFNFDIEYYGVVYFCTLCLKTVAEACDYVSNEDYNRILNDMSALQKQAKQLISRNQVLNATLRDCFNNGNDPNIDTLRDLSSVETEEPGTVESVGDATISTSDTNQSSVSEGSSSIHDDSKNSKRQSTDISDIFKLTDNN